MIAVLRWILLPFSLLYATVVWLRNRLYDFEVLKSKSFNLPVIVVGNLAVGGTGKSPMVEYLLRIVHTSCRVAVLSRGYGRKTKGFRYVETTSSSDEVGDEPLQIKRKFSDYTVAVCEDRCTGIENIQDQHDAILLDDAFQHRKLRPSFSILLFDFHSLRKPMLPLPTGNFRDSLYESHRANVIVVTKCPYNLDSKIRFDIQAKLQKYSHAPIFYAEITYHDLINDFGQTCRTETLKDYNVLLVTGIANPTPLVSYLHPKVKSIKHLTYGDHHTFSVADIAQMKASFVDIASTDKIIVTTEKDFQRLPPEIKNIFPLFYIPIQQRILFNQCAEFENMIKRAFVGMAD